MSEDPFADLVDEPALSSQAAVTALLSSAKRAYTPVRNSFVQRPPGSAERGSTLAILVRNRQERALDAILLVYALQPVLSNSDPLPFGTWAHLLSTRKPCSVTTVSKTFRVLEEFRLTVKTRLGHSTIVTPLMEDGTGKAWSKPGQPTADVDTGGYFAVPHDYWTAGYVDYLRLPGKAMLLIMLKETQGTPAFEMAVERASEWYGISERTAERGYTELSNAGLLDIHVQRVASPRLPPGVRRERYHRALRTPFSTTRRRELQIEARKHSRATDKGA
ncbi:hypothetical protein [Nocardia sp. NPDC058497]|uniref:hypothetical protein n=1 Tax=Nocardia sp. NPDC058497 TaxID=3346529 RepID=UPI003648913C